MHRLEREGECKKCGDCCQGCVNLGADRRCKVYEKRPDWCNQDYPRSFDVLSPRCGYRFIKVPIEPRESMDLV